MRAKGADIGVTTEDSTMDLILRVPLDKCSTTKVKSEIIKHQRYSFGASVPSFSALVGFAEPPTS